MLKSQPHVATKILKELLPHRWRLVLVAITGLIMAGATAQTAVLIKNLMDNLQKGLPDQLLVTGGYLILLGFVGAISRYLHYFNMNFTGEMVSQALRQRLQSKFMRLNLAFHGQYASGSGGLISRILADISMVQTGLRLFADLFREPVSLLLLIGWLFWLDWKLTLAVLVVLPVILGMLKQLARSVNKYSHQGQSGLEKITNTVKESLDGMRVIQSFNLESEMERRFQQEFEPYLQARKKIHSRIEVNGPVTEFIATVLLVSILIYMSLRVNSGVSTWGDIFSYLGAMLMINKPLKALQDAFVRSQEMFVSACRVYEIIDAASEVPVRKILKPVPNIWNMIEFRNVSFRYGEEWVLRNVNLQIRRGQVVALVGASGSGKSTIVNLLERFYDPVEGQILVDGVEIQDFALQEWRKQIGLVTQDVFLFNDSIENNIWSGDFSRSKEKVIQASITANAHQFISSTRDGYQTRVGERGNMFSGGEKQRISIARAVFKDAPLLILDEATSALDSASEQEVQKGLDQSMVGRTSIVIAHRLSTVRNADVIYVFQKGQLLEVGNHEQLMSSNGEYAKLVKMQSYS